MAGISVVFAVTAGGGSVAGASATTDAGGIATVGSWTLGTTVGPNTLTASASGAIGSPITFAATGTAGAAAAFSINAGNAQSAVAGAALAIVPSVKVLDANGNGVAGTVVVFAVVSGGGSITGGSATTNPSGIASIGGWTLGTTVGSNTLSATATGLPGSPLIFTATGTVGAAATLAANAGNAQSATVATALAIAPSVKVTDANGNAVPGTTVTFAVASGGGSITGGSATTDASGIATVGSWTLGNATGSNTLTATASGLAGSPLTFTATANSAAAAGIAINAGNSQTATAGSAVSTKPSVKVTDIYGNPVSGVSVTFAAASGGGSVTGGTQTTGTDGIATVGSWTLGTTAGANTLTATSTGLSGSPLTFTATGTVGAATALAVNAGNAQSATVATAVSIKPSVKVSDANGNAVSGVSVTFAVASGGGSVTGATSNTGSDGIATVGSWTLGTTAGANTLTATSTGLTGSPLTFTATGLAGSPSVYGFVAGTGQIEVVSSTLPITPIVRVVDQYGNRVAGVSVSFSVTGGGGTIGVASASTNSSGEATPTSWRLGSSEGFNLLQATATGFPAIQLRARAVPVSNFTFEIRYVTGGQPSAAVQAMIGTAVARLRKVFVGAPGSATVNLSANGCISGQSAMNESVPGTVIWMDVRSVDGVGGNLGSAAPCLVRSPGNVTAVGKVTLDADDLVGGLTDGSALTTTVHEFLHVMGYGLFWSSLGLVSGASTVDPYFVGSNAVGAFNSSGGSAFSGNKVPVENTGGSGSRDIHWRTSLMTRELMTAFSCSGNTPFSFITIASIADMGIGGLTAYGDDDYTVTFQGCPAGFRAFRREEPPQPQPVFIREGTGEVLTAAEAGRLSSAAASRRGRFSRPTPPAQVLQAKKQ